MAVVAALLERPVLGCLALFENVVNCVHVRTGIGFRTGVT
jgi:hypothetical protein